MRTRRARIPLGARWTGFSGLSLRSRWPSRSRRSWRPLRACSASWTGVTLVTLRSGRPGDPGKPRWPLRTGRSGRTRHSLLGALIDGLELIGQRLQLPWVGGVGDLLLDTDLLVRSRLHLRQRSITLLDQGSIPVPLLAKLAVLRQRIEAEGNDGQKQQQSHDDQKGSEPVTPSLALSIALKPLHEAHHYPRYSTLPLYCMSPKGNTPPS